MAELAGRPATIEEAEMKLNLKSGELTEKIESDPEVRDIWRKKRLEIFLIIKDSLYESAKAGKMQAIKTIERLLTNEIGRLSEFDIRRITIKQMEQITGKTRQTIHNWHTRYGLSRNTDSTFDLPTFIAWLEDFVIGKNIKGMKNDPLRALKIQKMQRDMKLDSGQLIERPTVLAGILARHQRLLGSISEARRKQLAAAVKNQPQSTIEDILGNYFSDVLAEQLEVPDMLKLNDEQKEKFRELLSQLED